jgi:hypothetical protein
MLAKLLLKLDGIVKKNSRNLPLSCWQPWKEEKREKFMDSNIFGI